MDEIIHNEEEIHETLVVPHLNKQLVAEIQKYLYSINIYSYVK